MALPTCECVAGQNLEEKLASIYCALLEILANGGGGAVTLADITDMSAFWKATLSGTPAADKVFGTDGAGVFTTFDLSVQGEEFLKITAGGSVLAVLVNSDNTSLLLRNPEELSTFIAEGAPGVDGSQSPPTTLTTVNGIVTALG